MFKYIEPEVPGGLGDKTEMDTSIHPPIVHSFECYLDGWLGDCILEIFPCFIVTQAAKDDIENLKLTGIVFDDLTVTKTEIFNEFYQHIEIPKLFWAKINGLAGIDDFGLSNDFRLVISESSFNVLNVNKLQNAIFSDFE